MMSTDVCTCRNIDIFIHSWSALLRQRQEWQPVVTRIDTLILGGHGYLALIVSTVVRGVGHHFRFQVVGAGVGNLNGLTIAIVASYWQNMLILL